MTTDRSHAMDHVIVVMFENRSFDTEAPGDQCLGRFAVGAGRAPVP
jgi:hypothetical protein